MTEFSLATFLRATAMQSGDVRFRLAGEKMERMEKALQAIAAIPTERLDEVPLMAMEALK